MWSVTHCWPIFIISVDLLNRPPAWPQLPILQHVPTLVQPFRSAILQSSKYFCHIWCVMSELKTDLKLGGPCHTLALCKYFVAIFFLLRVVCYTRSVYLACFYHFNSSGQLITSLTSIVDSTILSHSYAAIQIWHLVTIKIFLSHMYDVSHQSYLWI